MEKNKFLLFFVICSFMFLTSCKEECSKCSKCSKSNWVSLFDGKTLNGWKKSKVGVARFVVENGTVKGTTVQGSLNTFLLTEKEYSDFELKFDVKVDTGLNSGVQIRSRETLKKHEHRDKTASFVNGPQVEIEARTGVSAYVYGEETGDGWLSKAPKDKKYHNFFKKDQWNTYKVVAKGSNIKTFLNGELIEDLDNKSLYDRYPKGHIGLQVHSIGRSEPFNVYWRNIYIKELK